MTLAKTATERGLEPHWKVRVVLHGAMLYLASWSEPRREVGISGIKAEWIKEHEYGDTIGYIDWDAVVAVTWRFAP